MDEGLLKAAGELFQQITNIYGPFWSLVIFFVLLLAVIAWKLYQQWRADREVNLVIAEKERTIQCLANENAMYRVEDLCRKGWTRNDAISFVKEGAVPLTGAPTPETSTYLPKQVPENAPLTSHSPARKKR